MLAPALRQHIKDEVAQSAIGVNRPRRVGHLELIDQLRNAEAKASGEAANLSKLQQQLFDLEREIAAARALNESLEAKIRDKELGR